MNVYIQKNEENLPHHFDCSCALYGAIEHSLNYKLVIYEDVKNGKYDNLIKNHLFVGSVEFMKEVFKRVRIKENSVRVPINSNRLSEKITLKEAHLRVSKGETLFVKPLDIKLFTGLILDGCKYSCLENLDENILVLAYKPFESKIKSEWRVYINNNNIVDSRNYSGDFRVNIDYEYVEKVIQENEDSELIFPSAYTIDVGVLESSENVVIEFNDMWAIGNYGIDNYTYLKLLKNRYFEIIKNNTV